MRLGFVSGLQRQFKFSEPLFNYLINSKPTTSSWSNVAEQKEYLLNGLQNRTIKDNLSITLELFNVLLERQLYNGIQDLINDRPVEPICSQRILNSSY